MFRGYLPNMLEYTFPLTALLQKKVRSKVHQKEWDLFQLGSNEETLINSYAILLRQNPNIIVMNMNVSRIFGPLANTDTSKKIKDSN